MKASQGSASQSMSSHAGGPGGHPHGPPPDSDLPPAAPPPHVGTTVPPPGAGASLDNIPEECLAPSERAADELDHAGMDAVLPGEDQAREGRHPEPPASPPPGER